jgi:hypothetical protein
VTVALVPCAVAAGRFVRPGSRTGVTRELADQIAFDLADGRCEYVYTHDEGAVARAAHAFVGVLLAARG